MQVSVGEELHSSAQVCVFVHSICENMRKSSHLSHPSGAHCLQSFVFPATSAMLLALCVFHTSISARDFLCSYVPNPCSVHKQKRRCSRDGSLWAHCQQIQQAGKPQLWWELHGTTTETWAGTWQVWEHQRKKPLTSGETWKAARDFLRQKAVSERSTATKRLWIQTFPYWAKHALAWLPKGTRLSQSSQLSRRLCWRLSSRIFPIPALEFPRSQVLEFPYSHCWNFPISRAGISPFPALLLPWSSSGQRVLALPPGSPEFRSQKMGQHPSWWLDGQTARAGFAVSLWCASVLHGWRFLSFFPAILLSAS